MATVKEVKLMKDGAMVTPVVLADSVKNLDGTKFKDHNHDGRYYTESEIDSKLNNYAKFAGIKTASTYDFGGTSYLGMLLPALNKNEFAFINTGNKSAHAKVNGSGSYLLIGIGNDFRPFYAFVEGNVDSTFGSSSGYDMVIYFRYA